MRELCLNYGEIHGFWWDMNVPRVVDRSINAMIRELQPRAAINNRSLDEGDFGTPERDFDQDDALAFERPTQANQSVGAESWGFRHDEDFYTDRHLMRSIARYLARDASYLLNVGPQSDGEISLESSAWHKRIGAWHKRVREAFENVEPASSLIHNRAVLLTRRDNTLYVILHREPISQGVKLKPLCLAPRRATLLNTGQEVSWALDLVPGEHLSQSKYLRLAKLPVNELCNTVPVVKLEFDHLPIEAASAEADAGVMAR